jgi:hypothetical protein
LNEAVECLQKAQLIRTESNFPEEWATDQVDLGLTHGLFAPRDKNRLRQAVSCFEAALRVQTEVNTPAKWARTQYFLGITLSLLAVLESEGVMDTDGLQKARACLEAAKRGYESVGMSDADDAAEQIANIDAMLRGDEADETV